MMWQLRQNSEREVYQPAIATSTKRNRTNAPRKAPARIAILRNLPSFVRGGGGEFGSAAAIFVESADRGGGRESGSWFIE